MAVPNKINLCSSCDASRAKYMCMGCKNYFCPQDFKLHEEELLKQFDDEVVVSHNELLNQALMFYESNSVESELLVQITDWKVKSIENIEKIAAQASRKLIQIINKEKENIKAELARIKEEIVHHQEYEGILEVDIAQLRSKLDTLKNQLDRFDKRITIQPSFINYDKASWKKIINIHCIKQKIPSLLTPKVKWTQNGKIVAGGHGMGSELKQCSEPHGIFVDDEKTVYVADWMNHRIVEWKHGSNVGRIVAGGNQQGSGLNQLNNPTDIILDKNKVHLIICDYGNKRIVRWPKENGQKGEILISDIGCWGLAMDSDEFLYVVDRDERVIKKYRIGENHGQVVAGGNGSRQQLYDPTFVAVDQDHSIYVSDKGGNRVMRWTAGADHGTIVVGEDNQKNNIEKLANPQGIKVDRFGRIYVVDNGNRRIMCWSPGVAQGWTIIDGNNKDTPICSPIGLSFDHEGSLYVSDRGNHQVQKFEVKST